MSDSNDFIIEKGVLKKYVGSSIDVVIPERVTEIGSNAFNIPGFSQQIRSISLPQGLISIGTNAFTWCCALEKIVLPDGVEKIGSKAFNLCTNLREIDVPESVTDIILFCFW